MKISAIALATAMLASSVASSYAAETVALLRGMNNSPVFAMMECGVRKAANERGAKLLADGPAKWDVTLQLPLVRALVAQKPDVLVLDPNSPSQAFADVVNEALKNKAKVVLLDNGLGQYTPEGVPYLAMNDLNAGDMLGTEMGKLTGGKGSVLILHITPGIPVVDRRADGIRRGLEKYPEIKILQPQYGENDANKISGIVNSTLSANSDLAGIIAVGDITGEYAAAALTRGGKTDIPLFAFDATPSEMKWLNEGGLDGLAAWNPYQLGYDATKIGFDMLGGKPSPGEVKPQEYKFITRENQHDPELGNYIYKDDCEPRR